MFVNQLEELRNKNKTLNKKNKKVCVCVQEILGGELKAIHSRNLKGRPCENTRSGMGTLSKPCKEIIVNCTKNRTWYYLRQLLSEHNC